MLSWLRRVQPFQTADSKRLAALFAIVYFSQGMYALADQTIAIMFKDRGLQPDQVAYFFLLASVPWFIKPLYGLLSDFVPLFGRRRKSYLMLSSAVACAMGTLAALSPQHSYGTLALFYTGMGLGLAFTDVLTDALMVENGKPLGLTGAFQSVQWACVTCAAIIVGMLGGHFAQQRDLNAAFAVAALFPLIVLLTTVLAVHEKPVAADRTALRSTLLAARSVLADRSMWLVPGFIVLFTFSPSFGPAFLFYETDVLGFDQQFIGILGSINSAASVVGALIYAPLSRAMSLRRLINLAIGLAVLSTLAYLLYRGAHSAAAIQPLWGCAGMIAQLALLDLAAKACPQRVEATFFALMMSLINLASQASQSVGAHLYTVLGQGQAAYTRLVLISAATTAAVWLLVPLVRIERIEARAAADANRVEAAAP